MEGLEVEKAHLELRKATKEDATRICEIRDKAWMEAYPNTELGISREDIRRNAQGLNGEFLPRRIAHIGRLCERNTDPKLSIRVAVDNNEVIGYVMPSVDERGRYFISGLYVTPTSQGRGAGSALLTECIEQIGRENDIYLEVVAYNTKAIQLYEKFGFSKTDEIPEEEEVPDFMTHLPQIIMVLPKKQ